VARAGGAASGQTALRTAAGPIRIVTMYAFEPDEVRQIQAAVPGKTVETVMARNRDEYRTLLRDAEVVYGEIRSADLDCAPKSKWIQSGAAGIEWMDDTFRKHPSICTNYARMFAPAILETTIGMLLCLARGITKYYMPQYYKRQMKPAGTMNFPTPLAAGFVHLYDQRLFLERGMLLFGKPPGSRVSCASS
jgi:phosphoglycerate dehydrogenase-like enzyme